MKKQRMRKRKQNLKKKTINLIKIKCKLNMIKIIQIILILKRHLKVSSNSELLIISRETLQGKFLMEVIAKHFQKRF